MKESEMVKEQPKKEAPKEKQKEKELPESAGVTEAIKRRRRK